MSKVISMKAWKRARLGPTQNGQPSERRTRFQTGRRGDTGGFVSIGEISDALLRRLTE